MLSFFLLPQKLYISVNLKTIWRQKFKTDVFYEIQNKLWQKEWYLCIGEKLDSAIGKISSACLLSEIGDVNRFDSAKKLTAFIGIDPRTYESGTSIKGKGYITKRGSKVVRKTLYNAAMTSIQTPNIFQRFYLKKLSEGKPKKVCLVVVMRKMIHVVYSVWKNNKPFIDMNNESIEKKDLTLS